MSDDQTRQEIIDRCIERLLDGESLDGVLSSYPGQAAELLPLLEAAGTLAAAPLPQPSAAARSLAMSRMLAQAATQAQRPKPVGVLAWLGMMRARPLAFQALAVAGAVVLFAGLGFGASAATGTTPSPVRAFFRLPDDSPNGVRLSGAVLTASEGSLVIDTAEGQQTIGLGSSTVLDRGDGRIAWSELRAGDTVDVSGTKHDGRITAKRVRVEPLPAATVTPPAAERTPGPDDGDGTETPRVDRTPDRGDDTSPGQAEATATAGEHGGDDHGGSTPQATTSPEPEATRTPTPTKSPDHEDTRTPDPTQTPSSGSGGDVH